mmetsp:Transcript_34157/g.72782  ORF Transcript_34157/g.72782 Transcript_34157/m.72782 type:complete len:391 (-) Transcript_34157:126-1298(-)
MVFDGGCLLGAAAAMETQACVGGAVVVFAKCPIAGSSKTRLAPLLGAEGAARLAKAMLSDVLVSLSECALLRNTLKVLVYAPGTQSGESHIVSILHSLHLSYHMMDIDPSKDEQSDQINSLDENREHNVSDATGWILLPMKSSAPTNSNIHTEQKQSPIASKSCLTSSSLGGKLEDALERTRKLISSTVNDKNKSNLNEAVLFLGMDSPELPIEEIVYGLQQSNDHSPINEHTSNCKANKSEKNNGKAHMCPAHDGGYGLLSVPKHAPSSKIFSSVRWSNSLTAVSQLKALTDCGVQVSLGKLMYDVDEPADVKSLTMRLARSRGIENRTKDSFSAAQTDDSLSNLSSGISLVVSSSKTASYPHHTWKALLDLNAIQSDGGNLNTLYRGA